ncbi:hypothetical protein NP493_106g01048 [Ridgeia piscesae]|uniref:Uncharacterized protein n=1 Tax=Ridgeia piscesae TaxID=27915 RepID=A0AAD9P767_RIDPI|nr:hypothetical protein NP493_106g01048 [Ridgeia piscesae]
MIYPPNKPGPIVTNTGRRTNTPPKVKLNFQTVSPYILQMLFATMIYGITYHKHTLVKCSLLQIAPSERYSWSLQSNACQTVSVSFQKQFMSAPLQSHMTGQLTYWFNLHQWLLLSYERTQ